jgi:hypothetical protein
VNNLPSALTRIENITPILYADDTTVTVSSNSHKSLIDKARLVTDKISKWAQDNFLIVNPNKSNLIHFLTNGLPIESMLIKMEKKSIAQVNACKFLGLFLDYKMSWVEHINSLRRKLSSSCFILKQLSQT